MIDPIISLYFQVEAFTQKLDGLLASQQQSNPYYSISPPLQMSHPSWSMDRQEWVVPQENFHVDAQIEEDVSRLENVLYKFIQATDARFQTIEDTLKCHDISMKNLEHQVGEILDILSRGVEESERVVEVPCLIDEIMNDNDEVEQHEDFLNEHCACGQENFQGGLLTTSVFQGEEFKEDANPKTMDQAIFSGIDQLLQCKKKMLGIEEDVDRRLKSSKDPPAPSLDNSQPNMFPWRPKIRWFEPPTISPTWLENFWFMGSSYAHCGQKEHTLFKPP